MTDDGGTDTPTNPSKSSILVVASGDRGSVFFGAVLVGISSFSAIQTLAVRASGNFPPGDALGALFTLAVFAFGTTLLLDGAAGVFAEKSASA
ncbi:hypothetical protein SAMN04488063_0576 [Halopelagius inordinatus]|uniref:Uncharacterized protein n=1 Tax=Halopelagius inordinatus TaxID=553467 RepID=A0A1I2M6V2_9EURY|nr:hypothetical protein [Halopelagius inordinatus]SFF86549.1 hypothetical protein SAMN04488063_0576 [Halopelagius inordinatus]